MTAPSGVMLRSDAGRGARMRKRGNHRPPWTRDRDRPDSNVFTIGGSGALVYWRGAYNSIGWTDDEVRRAVGLFPAAR